MSLNPTESSNRQRFLPKISVIVPIYNGEADLLDLLGCLQAQTYAADRVEYLLVDNGSHDRTASLLQTAVQEAASLEITLRYLQEDRIQSLAIRRQVFERVGLFRPYLYGVELMRDLTAGDYLYRLGRWVVKEVPVNSMKAIARQTPAIDIISTPIGLFGARARAAGQREAQLPEKAREIEGLQNVQGVSSEQYPDS